MSGWDNFLLAQVGASAALAGLVFVGVSINLTRILSTGSLPVFAKNSLNELDMVNLGNVCFNRRANAGQTRGLPYADQGANAGVDEGDEKKITLSLKIEKRIGL